jgi:VWFA-related protein
VVGVDVVVTDNNGNYLTGLKKENFRITEDGTVQTISNFAPSDAPITIVLLLEFSKLGYQVFAYNARNWAAAFLGNLKPTDYVALETFNMRPKVEVDFTHNGQEVMQGISALYYPPFSESNLFDAISDVLDRTKDVKGKKAVLVLASGIDTFSKMTLDQAMKRIRETDATIFTIGVGAQLFMSAEARSSGGGFGENLTFLQAENQLKTFAAMTGGRSWSPRFDGEIPSIMQDIAASLRNQYSMAYSPSNTTLDGKYRKIKVELVAPDGGPLTVNDQRGKKVKFQVYARQGYTAPSSNVQPN